MPSTTISRLSTTASTGRLMQKSESVTGSALLAGARSGSPRISTGAPSRRRCRPLATTFSPAARPATHLDPADGRAGRARSSRRTARPSAVANTKVVRPSASTACSGIGHRLALGEDELDVHEHAGWQAGVGIGQDGAHPEGARHGVDPGVDRRDLAGEALIAERRRSSRSTVWPGRIGPKKSSGTANSSSITDEVVERGQDGVVVDAGADIDLPQSDHAGERRAHGAVGEPRARAVEARPGAVERRLQLVDGGLRDGVVAAQLRGPLVGQIGLAQRSARLGDLGLLDLVVEADQDGARRRPAGPARTRCSTTRPEVSGTMSTACLASVVPTASTRRRSVSARTGGDLDRHRLRAALHRGLGPGGYSGVVAESGSRAPPPRTSEHQPRSHDLFDERHPGHSPPAPVSFYREFLHKAITTGAAGAGSSTRPAGASGTRGSSAGEVLLEERDRARPGELGRVLVVARLVGVVVEGVVGALVDVELVVDARVLERLLVGRDAGVDAFVEAGIVQQQRRLDLGGVLGARRLRGRR